MRCGSGFHYNAAIAAIKQANQQNRQYFANELGIKSIIWVTVLVYNESTPASTASTGRSRSMFGGCGATLTFILGSKYQHLSFRLNLAKFHFIISLS